MIQLCNRFNQSAVCFGMPSGYTQLFAGLLHTEAAAFPKGATVKKCSRCKINPTFLQSCYCYLCRRIANGKSEFPRFYIDGRNKACTRCRKPRAKGSGSYCVKCSREINKAWRKSKGGSYKTLTAEQKRRNVVRVFINRKAKAGLVSRDPCLICGNPNTEFHHLNYNPKTYDVINLCKPHHVEIEQLKKLGLSDDTAIAQLRNEDAAEILAAIAAKRI